MKIIKKYIKNNNNHKRSLTIIKQIIKNHKKMKLIKNHEKHENQKKLENHEILILCF